MVVYKIKLYKENLLIKTLKPEVSVNRVKRIAERFNSQGYTVVTELWSTDSEGVFVSKLERR